MPPHQNEIETNKIEKVLEKHKEQCPYRKDKETWFDSKMLKILGIGYTISAPWFIWASVSIFSLNAEVALVKQKQDVIQEINLELKEIRKEINTIKVDIAYLKRNP